MDVLAYVAQTSSAAICQVFKAVKVCRSCKEAMQQQRHKDVTAMLSLHDSRANLEHLLS